MKRNRRAGVEDRWTKTVRDEQGNTQTVPSANDGKESVGAHAMSTSEVGGTRRDSRARLMLNPGWTARPRPSSQAPTLRHAMRT
jgi:hypothetical protein